MLVVSDFCVYSRTSTNHRCAYLYESITVGEVPEQSVVHLPVPRARAAAAAVLPGARVRSEAARRVAALLAQPLRQRLDARVARVGRRLRTESGALLLQSVHARPPTWAETQQ